MHPSGLLTLCALSCTLLTLMLLLAQAPRSLTVRHFVLPFRAAKRGDPASRARFATVTMAPGRQYTLAVLCAPYQECVHAVSPLGRKLKQYWTTTVVAVRPRSHRFASARLPSPAVPLCDTTAGTRPTTPREGPLCPASAAPALGALEREAAATMTTRFHTT